MVYGPGCIILALNYEIFLGKGLQQNTTTKILEEKNQTQQPCTVFQLDKNIFL